MTQYLKDKSVLLIIGGGIAAYKCLELIRLIKKQGGSVRTILTKSGAEFVTPLSIGSLSGEKVYGDLFNLTDEQEMGHIELSRSADVVLVAPATADILAKMAGGLASDLATTALMATDKPVLVAPAMNVRMWEHKATQRNKRQLKEDGVTFIGPNEGDMACGEYGFGRMAEPEEILEALGVFFSKNNTGITSPDIAPLKGKTLLITAGPTHEPIDPVRYIANRSSGKQGYAIARAAAENGADVTLISGPTHLEPPENVRFISVMSAQDMLRAVKDALPCDIAIFTAAVADWRVKNASDEKIKKTSGQSPALLNLEENPDILKTVAHLKRNRPELVIGFAAETEDVIKHASDKLARKACDMIIANDVSPEKGVMGGDENTVHIITNEGVESWDKMSKKNVADNLIKTISAHLRQKTPPSKTKLKK